MTLTARPATAELLDLAPHPEGGWYRETWRTPTQVSLPGYPSRRHLCTTIYFLLCPGERSRWHTVRSDELWLWHSGGPLLLELGGSGQSPAAETSSMVLGSDLTSGQQPQVLVPAGVWQTARTTGDHETLVTCVVSPGFDFADFRLWLDDQPPERP